MKYIASDNLHSEFCFVERWSTCISAVCCIIFFVYDASNKLYRIAAVPIFDYFVRNDQQKHCGKITDYDYLNLRIELVRVCDERSVVDQTDV